MSKNDLQQDLLADLQGAANARPLPSASTLPDPVPPAEQLHPPTPAFDMRFTPLRWSRPRLVPAPTGLGLGLRAGPLQVTVALSS